MITIQLSVHCRSYHNIVCMIITSCYYAIHHQYLNDYYFLIRVKPGARSENKQNIHCTIQIILCTFYSFHIVHRPEKIPSSQNH